MLLDGMVIPAHPLALTASRALDERRQAALTRYYIDAGAGALAVGVHTTQFALRGHGLLRPVLELARDVAGTWNGGRDIALIAGAVGDQHQAAAEAALARQLGYDAVLLSLAALPHASDADLVAHCRAVAEVIPIVGFYLQPAVGGRVLGYRFWRDLVDVPNLVAIKVAPFSRYHTLDVVRALSASGREDVALYTGNDDAIVLDLLTPFVMAPDGRAKRRYMSGGLLGQWAVWTRQAVALLEEVRRAREAERVEMGLLSRGSALTDANGAIFDAANGFAGCIPGIHEVLRRQGLLAGTWCLDPHEALSPGQAEEIDRVCRSYPFLADDAFVAANLHRWLG